MEWIHARSRRHLFAVIALVLGCVAVLAGLPGNVRGAQEGTPLPPGAVGVTGAVLGAFPVAVAPGYELQVFRSEWAPGSSIDTHTHPGALVSCVESGELFFCHSNRRGDRDARP
jgi:quercetin dioxygenase-like cupin family protein